MTTIESLNLAERPNVIVKFAPCFVRNRKNVPNVRGKITTKGINRAGDEGGEKNG